jgi:hypothetical protein
VNQLEIVKEQVERFGPLVSLLREVYVEPQGFIQESSSKTIKIHILGMEYVINHLSPF